MTETLKALMGSKKFVAGIAGMIAAAIARVGYDLPAEDVALILSTLVAAIVSQGVADLGKEKARVEAKASNPQGEPLPKHV